MTTFRVKYKHPSYGETVFIRNIETGDLDPEAAFATIARASYLSSDGKRKKESYILSVEKLDKE